MLCFDDFNGDIIVKNWVKEKVKKVRDVNVDAAT